MTGIFRNAGAQNATDTAVIDQLNATSLDLLKKDPDQARTLARKAIASSEKIHYLRGLSDGYMRLGLIHKNAGAPDSAIWYYHRSLAYRKQMGDKDLIARACSNLGNVYHNTGKYDSAIHYHLKAVQLAESIKDTAGLIKYVNSAAIAYQKYKKPEQALIYYDRSLKLAVAAGDTEGSARARNNLASLYVDKGEYRKALSILHPVIAQRNDISDDILVNALNNVGLCYQSLQLPDSAMYVYALALQHADDMISNDVAAILSNLGLLYFEQDKLTMAADHLERSCAMAEPLADYQLLVTNYRQLGSIYSRLDRKDDAVEAMQQAIIYTDSLGYALQVQQVEELTAKYESEKKEAEIKTLKMEQELTALDRDRQRQLRNVAIAAGVVLLFIVILLFNRRSLQRNIEYQQKLTADRARISADLHDDIGSALSSISMYSELARERADALPKEEMHAYLNEIAGTSRELLDSMSDLVWAVNPANDSMEKMLSRVQTFGTRLCAPRQIAFAFQYPESMENLTLDMEVRHCLYMIIKEAVHNAVKYAEASEIRVRMQQLEHGIQIEVSDNGKGFDVEQEYEGNGLRNMRRRAGQIGADLRFFSAPGKATGVRLEYGDKHHRLW